MITGSGSNAAQLYMTSYSPDPTVKPIAPKTEPVLESSAALNVPSADALSLTTASMDPSQIRLLKIEQLRNDIESGQYRVSSSALASAMLDKAETGQAPELSFLPASNLSQVPS